MITTVLGLTLIVGGLMMVVISPPIKIKSKVIEGKHSSFLGLAIVVIGILVWGI